MPYHHAVVHDVGHNSGDASVGVDMRRLVPPLLSLGAVLFAVTWIVEPNLIIGLRSPRALAWAAGLGVLCALVGLATFRLTRRPVVALALAVLPGVIATGVVVVRPIVNARELDEALPTTAPTPGVPASAATRLTGGELRGLAGHDAHGQVATYRLADGSHVVRFEGVDIGGTPSPHVYVLDGADRRKKGGLHLGKLKAERGSFNYVLPTSFQPKNFTVLVWCEQFAIEIANATQA